MRLLLAASLLALSAASLAQSPPGIVTQPSRLDAQWQAKTRAIYEKSIEIPTDSGRSQMPLQADLIAADTQLGLAWARLGRSVGSYEAIIQ